MTNENTPVESTHAHARTLVETLVDDGPGSRKELCEWLKWSDGRFTAALSIARQVILPSLELTIPTPTPPRYHYRVTDQWEHVSAGVSFSMGSVESRLRGIARDVRIVLPKLDRHDPAQLLDWRQANFLNHHLLHILSTLAEINGDRGAGFDETGAA